MKNILLLVIAGLLVTSCVRQAYQYSVRIVNRTGGVIKEAEVRYDKYRCGPRYMEAQVGATYHGVPHRIPESAQVRWVEANGSVRDIWVDVRRNLPRPFPTGVITFTLQTNGTVTVSGEPYADFPGSRRFERGF